MKVFVFMYMFLSPQLLHVNESNDRCSKQRIAEKFFSSWVTKKLQAPKFDDT